MLWLRLWRWAWLLLALICGYLLYFGWQLSLLTLTPLDPVAEVKHLLSANRYVAAAEQVDYFLEIAEGDEHVALTALKQDIAAHRAQWDYQLEQTLLEPLFLGTADETPGQAVALLSTLVGWGDVRDLVQQGWRYVQAEPVDEWIITLSALGLTTSALQLLSGGSTTPARAGVALLAVAHKSGTLTADFRRFLTALSRQSLSVGRLQPVLPTLQRLVNLVDQVGVRTSLGLLQHVTGPGSLNRLSRLTLHFGTQTSALLRVAGTEALTLAQRVNALGGPEVIKQASRYGVSGVRTLATVGPVRWLKYGARLAKIGYQYSWLQALAKALLRLPTWVLLWGCALGVLFGLPWPWRKLFS